MNLWELTPALLIGWPAILASLVMCVTGIVRAKPRWLVVAAVLITPISLYLAATPRFRWIAMVFPILLLGASIAVRRSLTWLAWSLFVLCAGFFGWLAIIVANE
jgi:hypothetical protein